MKTKVTILIALSLLLALFIFSNVIYALPTAPAITYVSNSTAAGSISNRSIDAKGTITTIRLSANQQNFKWKAYVGNVTGRVALDDSNGLSIYDWDLGTSSGGEVFVSRSSNITWSNVACANQASIDNEHVGVGMSLSAADSINRTFNYTNHRAINVSTIPLSGCRSISTYVNDSAQVMGSTALFQELLLMDSVNSNLVYATIMEAGTTGYSAANDYNFQLIVAENESATVPTNYYFWVELG